MLDSAVFFPILVPDIVTGIALLSFYSLIRFSLGHPLDRDRALGLGDRFRRGDRPHPAAWLRPFDRGGLTRPRREGDPDLLQDDAAVICPGVLAAALVVFTLSVDEFVIAYFTAGQTVTFPIKVYR